MMRSNSELERAGNRILEVSAYGDSAGLPVEKWSASQISQEYGKIKGLMPASINPFFRDEYIAGVWSDDTQFSTAVSESLVDQNGFDIESIAEFHIDQYLKTPKIEHKGRQVSRGWGRSSQESIERLIGGIAPDESGARDGVGNGALIKLAPLVFWQVARGIDDEERHHQYDQLTTMTHDNDTARLATRVHGDFLRHLLLSDFEPEYPFEKSGNNLAEFVLESVRIHEDKLRAGNELSKLLGFILDSSLIYKPREILAHTDGKGFYAPQTLAMSYGTFILCLGEFTPTVYTAVNMGGDTDSNASIVANMINFFSKGEFKDPEDIGLLDKRRRLINISERLTRLALKDESAEENREE